MSNENCETGAVLQDSLLKFTNVFNGWQPRWFVLHFTSGELRYYLSQDQVSLVKPRGMLHLRHCQVMLSDEGGHIFSVQPSHGDPFKIKATSSKQRQEWTDRIRSVISNFDSKKSRTGSAPSLSTSIRSGAARESAVLTNLQKLLTSASDQQVAIERCLAELPTSGAEISALDDDVLMFKAASKTLLGTLDDCAQTLQQLQGVVVRYDGGAIMASADGSQQRLASGQNNVNSNNLMISALQNNSGISPRDSTEMGQEALGFSMDIVDPTDEVSDTEDNCTAEEEGSSTYGLGTVENESNKANLMASLAQLKLGSDMTKVALPSFVLQPRSLLETWSDFFANAELFTSITDGTTPESRMLNVVKWYLSSINYGCRSGVIKKPYNALLGEVFRCTWVAPSGPKIKFVSEQVSRHPVVSAFYAGCEEKKTHLNCHVWVKAKFMGMSVQVNLEGECFILLQDHDEVYNISFPVGYARSILTNPWFELGGKVTITCAQTALSSVVVFQTRPFYGGKLHSFSAEVKNRDLQAIYNVSGEWNGVMEFRPSTASGDGTVKTPENPNLAPSTVDLTTMTKAKRCIRLVDTQNDRESRKIWKSVTDAILKNDLEETNTARRAIENEERLSGKSKSNRVPLSFFVQDKSTWRFRNFPPMPST